MATRRIFGVLLVALALAAQSPHHGNRWAQFEREMQDPVDDPPGAWDQTEFAFARLRYRSPRDHYFRRFLRWGTDSNKSERIYMKAIRRLTRVDTRSVEEIVDIDSDEMFNWPFLYAVGVGDWSISDSQAARLRQYFDRGGFLMVDDFHNEREWAFFMAGIHKIFPNRDAVEIPGDHDSLSTPFRKFARGLWRIGLRACPGERSSPGYVDFGSQLLNYTK